MVVKDARVVERVLLREEVTHELTVLALLRGIRQVLNHQGLLDRVLPHLPEELVLVDEGQLCASRVKQDLVDHVIRASAIPDRSIKD